MNLTLTRLWLTEQSSCGELHINDARFCYTLELPNKDGKPGSCIAQGTYSVIVTHSPKFGRDMPLILVTDRSDIRIHWGNKPEDTEGCILLGYEHSADFIGQSRDAFNEFFAKAEAEMRAGGCRLTVVGGYKAQVHPADLSMQGDV
jgi:hypothetical protein